MTEATGSTRLLSGTDIARFLSIHQTTWGRWSRRGIAPAPVHEAENLKLYDRDAVIAFLGKLGELVGGEVAA